jgi:hypothetical protein
MHLPSTCPRTWTSPTPAYQRPAKLFRSGNLYSVLRDCGREGLVCELLLPVPNDGGLIVWHQVSRYSGSVLARVWNVVPCVAGAATPCIVPA